MKRPRPYIPLSVRVKVAEAHVKRIFHAKTFMFDHYQLMISNSPHIWPLGVRLDWLLDKLFPPGVPYHLDHDPALILRLFNPKTGKYKPDANDPNHLRYRIAEEHQQKTTGRKPGAERTVTTKGSDIWLKTKFARLDRPAKKKQKIPSRPFSRKPAVDKKRRP